MRIFYQFVFHYFVILVLVASIGCASDVCYRQDKPFNEENMMTMIQSQVLKLLKSFKDDDNLDALSEASQLVQDMQVQKGASLVDQNSFRIDKMRLYLTILNEIDGKLIPNFDFDDVPMLSVSPPPESGLPSGVDPSSIADPKMRSEYEKTVLKNKQKAAIYSFQKKLVKINRRITDQTEDYMNSDFISKARDIPTLNKLIDEIVGIDRRKVELKQFIKLNS